MAKKTEGKSIATVMMVLSKIKPNPNNPRVRRDSKFKKLVQSVIDFPEMLQIRPIVLNRQMMVLGGNQRYEACKEAKLKLVPVIIANNLSPEQEREFIIKDNVSVGEWDFEMIGADWGKELITDWGLDLPKVQKVSFDAAPKVADDLWFLNIEFDSEAQCQELFERLKAEGFTVKIVQ